MKDLFKIQVLIKLNRQINTLISVLDIFHSNKKKIQLMKTKNDKNLQTLC